MNKLSKMIAMVLALCCLLAVVPVVNAEEEAAVDAGEDQPHRQEQDQRVLAAAVAVLHGKQRRHGEQHHGMVAQRHAEDRHCKEREADDDRAEP